MDILRKIFAVISRTILSGSIAPPLVRSKKTIKAKNNITIQIGSQKSSFKWIVLLIVIALFVVFYVFNNKEILNAISHMPTRMKEFVLRSGIKSGDIEMVLEVTARLKIINTGAGERFEIVDNSTEKPLMNISEKDVEKFTDHVFTVTLPTREPIIVPDEADKILAKVTDLTRESQLEGIKTGKGRAYRSFTPKQQIYFNEGGDNPIIDVYLK